MAVVSDPALVTQRFRPQDRSFLALPRPIAAYVGRVAVEKNIGAFLSMPWKGTKLIIGQFESNLIPCTRGDPQPMRRLSGATEWSVAP